MPKHPTKKPLHEQIKDQVAKDIFELKRSRPNLAIIVIGEDQEYLENIKKVENEAKKVGVDTHLYLCDENTTEQGAEEVINCLNNDDTVDAIYIQRPLPEEFNLESLLSLVKAEKDISFEDDFENIDWDLFSANLFKNTLELFKERHE